MAVFLGTPDDELIVGTNDGDEIFGEAGDDGIFSLDGDDTVFGGADVDLIVGGGGSDFLFGEDGNDVIFGDAEIIGVSGNDFISGGNGEDVVFGYTGNDTINGDNGNDVLNGDEGDDVLNGGNGLDQLFGGFGDDQLFGGFGGDLLFGDAGNDELFGEEGEDIINGGDGNDTAFGGSGNDRFFGGSGNDQFFGGSGNDLADGENGDDLLDGGKGDDTLFGSLGNDSLSGRSGTDALVGGVGSDSLSGGAGNDTLVGVDPFVPAFGFGGNGSPIAPFEIDTLTGGQGRDRFVLGDNGSVLGISREDAEPAIYYLGGGNSDYALITDFTLGRDVIQLADLDFLPVSVAESDDAGQLPFEAQVIAPGIESITGEISVGNDVDLFQITLDGGMFSATTLGQAAFDTQLFLFDENGSLVAGNDDSGGTLQSTLELSPIDPGTYFLAISSFNNDPVSESIFGGFTGDGFSTGSYSIELTGVQDATYTLGSSPEGVPSGTSISFGNDLIAVVQGVLPEELSLNSSNFDFV
jgi:Ca2+-binding RTX toxin-like protein